MRDEITLATVEGELVSSVAEVMRVPSLCCGRAVLAVSSLYRCKKSLGYKAPFLSTQAIDCGLVLSRVLAILIVGGSRGFAGFAVVIFCPCYFGC